MYPFCCVRLQHERADGTHRSVNVPIRQMKGTCHVSGLEDIVMRPLAMRAAGLSYLSWVPTAKGGLASCSGIGSPAKHMLAEAVAILTTQPGRRRAGEELRLQRTPGSKRMKGQGMRQLAREAVHRRHSGSVGVVLADAPADSSSRCARGASIERGRSPSTQTLH